MRFGTPFTDRSIDIIEISGIFIRFVFVIITMVIFNQSKTNNIE